MTPVLDTVLAWDTALFFWINNGWINPLFDRLMPFVSRFDNFRYPLLLLIVLLLWKGSVKGRFFVAAALMLLAVTDRGNSDLVKHLFLRPRPYEDLLGVHVYLRRQWFFTPHEITASASGTISFPSTHAVNVWAMGVLGGLFYPAIRLYAYPLAGLVCLSRVYVGHHYPLDVVGGSILGAGLAWGFYRLLRFATGKLDRRKRFFTRVFPPRREAES